MCWRVGDDASCGMNSTSSGWCRRPMLVELQHSRFIVWGETELVRIGAGAVLLILPRANSRAEELGIAGSSMQDYMTKMWC